MKRYNPRSDILGADALPGSAIEVQALMDKCGVTTNDIIRFVQCYTKKPMNDKANGDNFDPPEELASWMSASNNLRNDIFQKLKLKKVQNLKMFLCNVLVLGMT